MRRSVVMTRFVVMSGRVGLTRMWTRRERPEPLSVSPMIQRAVSPAAIGPCAGQAFARLERDVGDLAGRGIDLIERAFAPGIDLDGVVIALASRFDTRRGIGVFDAAGRRMPAVRRMRDRPGRRRVQRTRRLFRDRRRHGRQRRHVTVVADGGRFEGRAARQHRCESSIIAKADLRKAGEPDMRRRAHWDISRDQLMALM
jgi:hypothetical protein